MIEYRIHYGLLRGITRCGLRIAWNKTIDPAKVTCGNCKRLLGKEVK